MRSTDRRLRWFVPLLGLLLAGCARSAGPRQPDPAPVAAEYPTYESLDEMRHDTDAVVVAETTGDASPRPLPDQLVADYFQPVRVLEVLHGGAVAPKQGAVVTIVRLGLAGPSPRGGVAEHRVYGPLDPGRRVLFLRRSGGPGTWSVVGHHQGDMPLMGERTGDSPFAELRRRTPAEIRALLAGHG